MEDWNAKEMLLKKEPATLMNVQVILVAQVTVLVIPLMVNVIPQLESVNAKKDTLENSVKVTIEILLQP